MNIDCHDVAQWIELQLFDKKENPGSNPVLPCQVLGFHYTLLQFTQL